jgi:circadian clock protein KaiB
VISPRDRSHPRGESRPEIRTYDFWDLRLYIAGQTPRSLAAIDDLRRFCEERLAGRYKIELLDIMLNPRLARDDGVVAIPTLVRKLPDPIRKVVGDLSNAGEALEREPGTDAEEVVRAVRLGEVDAFLVKAEGADRVLVLDGADRPYRFMLEAIEQGALVIEPDGGIAHGNRRIHDLLGLENGMLLGERFASCLAEEDLPRFESLIEHARIASSEVELTLVASDGSRLPALVTAMRLLRRSEVLCLLVTDLRKDRLVSTLAEEIGEGLSPVRDGLEVLKLAGSRDEAVRSVCEILERQMEHILRLVGEIRDAGRGVSSRRGPLLS